MQKIEGLYNTAVIYADRLEETAAGQLQQLCDQPFVEGCRIRIMPDVHAGAGCVIGFTADLGDKVIPNIVGVDIGCGMLTVELGKGEYDLAALDRVIHGQIPAGKAVHEGRIVRFPKLQELKCFRALKDTKRIERSIGTLGGGNHFIEVDRDDEGCHYLVIHTGSRNLGKQVAEYYQNLAFEVLSGKDKLFEARDAMIAAYKAAGRRKELQAALKELQAAFRAKDVEMPRELCYLTGAYRKDYLHDMQICQEYAVKNRATIAELILDNWLGCGLETFSSFETIHNYIDHDSNIIRKGAVSAKAGERLLIPINMRDGSLICIGKGNPEWNQSAPHGAGRLYSRGAARAAFRVEEYEKEMAAVFTTSVNAATLDECPMAYKPMEAIVDQIGPTAKIERILRPVYNFKAGE